MAVKTLVRALVSKLVLVVALCPLLKSKSSFFDIEELRKLKYGVEINSEPVLLDQDAGENTMHITSKHGQKYQCVLPVLHIEGEDNSSRNITTDKIRVLLEPFNSTCLYLRDGWWTYQVCFGRSVYQYHEEGHHVKDNTSLGHYTGDTDWSQVTNEKNPSNKERYHSQFYSNGTTCDLTGELRKTEVRFFCESRGDDHIVRIDESSTCVYVITVYTNKLCNHTLFRPVRRPRTHSITCSPALVEEQFKTYSKSKTEAVEDVLVGDTGSDNRKEVEDKPKKRTPSIFEAIAKLFDKGVREKGSEGDDGVSNNDEDEKIDWQDVFKTSRSAIDKSVERLRKLKFGDQADDTEDMEGTTSEVRMQSTKGEEPISNDKLYKIEKEKSRRKSEYYEQLIEDLKIKYDYFKTQMEIVTNDMHKKIERLEKSPDNAVGAKLVERIKATVQRFEENQRAVDKEMKRLTDLNDAVADNPNYSTAKNDITGIRKRFSKLIEKLMSKESSLNDNDETEDMGESEATIEDEMNVKDESDIKGRQDKTFDMKSPRLDKVVSKLKNIMAHEGNEDLEGGERENSDGMFDDDRISVRVTKIKNSEEDLFDETGESLYADDSDKELEEINGDQEMKDATRKMESIVRRQLRDAGIKHDGKIKVKIITSKEALKWVAGGRAGFQVLTQHETNEFRDLLSNVLGGNEELMKEKKRQGKLEDNYNLVWRQDGFTSAKKDYPNTDRENSEKK